MVQDPHVAGAQAPRALDGRPCFFEAAGFEGCPGERVGAEDVVPLGPVFLRQRVGLLEMDVVVGFDIGDVAAVERIAADPIQKLPRTGFVS